MSVIPFTTQIGLQAGTQGSQTSGIKIVFVYTDRMTERQSALMKESQEFLCQNVGILLVKYCELDILPPTTRYFVIPTKDDLIKKIRSKFEKSVIYLPRAIIEARGHYRVNLPARNLAVSLTMHNCRVFLVRTCDLPSIRNRIHEMCGTIVPSFNDGKPNVVVTDKADDKYCSRAFKRGIPVVSRDWVDENYNLANEEDSCSFNVDAMLSLAEHQIKPFYGLSFKIALKGPGAKIKRMITENQGHVIYGNEKCLTHIVASQQSQLDLNENSESSGKPRVVDIDFLEMCIESGYHLTKKEYRERKNISSAQLSIKREPQTQCQQELIIPKEEIISQQRTSNPRVENHSMPPPPTFPSRLLREQQQQQQQQPDNVNDMILKALSFETAQTQLASTQMRQLPDRELRIEQTFEPSQQLYWNDNVSRRN